MKNLTTSHVLSTNLARGVLTAFAKSLTRLDLLRLCRVKAGNRPLLMRSTPGSRANARHLQAGPQLVLTNFRFNFRCTCEHFSKIIQKNSFLYKAALPSESLNPPTEKVMNQCYRIFTDRGCCPSF